nr:hypothetical protein [Tanacetum cinerariifolium]
MATTIEQQVVLDEALIPSTPRLRIRRSNFRFPSDIQSKESTLQLVYDVLHRCPFFKVFLVTADVSEIYMQEFWATAYVHQRSIRFKMNNKKHIVDLESFREMLYICPRILGQAFAELPFEQEILEFIWFLGQGATIRTLTDGLYHTKSIDYAFLIWEDFVYQVKHKNQKKSNKMYYPRFTKVIIHHFMSKDPQNTQQYGAMLPIELTNDEIRNTKAYKEYYAFATGEAAPKPKASARRKRSGSDTSITPPTATTTPTTTVVKIVLRRSRQQMHISQPGGSGTDEGTGSKPGVPDVPTNESEEELSWNSSDDEGANDHEKVGDDDEGDEGHKDRNGDERDDDDQDQEIAKHDDKDDTEESGDVDEEGESDQEDDNEKTRDEESFDPIPQTPKSSEDEGDDRLKSLEASFSKYIQTNPFAEAISNILDIVQQYMNQQMTEAVRVAVQIQTNKLCDSYQRENDEFLRTIDENMKRIIKEQVKVAADLSEMELKKILIEKMEGNKSIQCSDEQRNLYKAIVDAYEADKIILDLYGETVILKRRRAQEGLQQGLNLDRCRPTSLLLQRNLCRLPLRWTNPHIWCLKQPKKPPTPYCDWNKTLPAVQGSTQTWISELAKQVDSLSSFNELLDTLLDFSNFIMNQLRVDTLTLELLTGPTFELMKGSCTSLIELEYHLEERRIIAVTDLKIMEWHSYKHLDWISVRHDDEKIYKFKEGYFKRLRLQDIEDMLLLLEQGKLSNLTVEERFAYNVSLRMFTQSIVIQGFIYQNKDKKNRLMRIDELHKFNDGTLNDVCNALDDHLKGIRMQYLPQTIWRKCDKDRAAAMIQAIDKMLKTRRIMRSLEKFIGGRLYEGDFRMLQRTI